MSPVSIADISSGRSATSRNTWAGRPIAGLDIARVPNGSSTARQSLPRGSLARPASEMSANSTEDLTAEIDALYADVIGAS